ncbi:hypothetical protein J11TS1_24920 [Oceanobacillus sp. J11TS1]|nr:hypothetical protein J11TS1_24920 [Oceanobacillus sp. J11TS1]
MFKKVCPSFPQLDYHITFKQFRKPMTIISNEKNDNIKSSQQTVPSFQWPLLCASSLSPSRFV